MLKSKSRWQVAKNDTLAVEQFIKELNISPLVAQLLANRGITTLEAARRFLYIEEVDFYDPYLLEDMELAVSRIREAIVNKEQILIFGDYDADGVSSTAVMFYTMRELGANFDYYIPNRFTEGYGPNEKAFRKAKEQGYRLIVTVDTGIAAVHEAEVAKELGIDLIITDHHEPQPELPDAYAIINPKKESCPYPFKGLAGVGVAFKVAHALLGKVPNDLLDIVAIGTVADLVPLVDENRLLVKKGIDALQVSRKPGIKALKKTCGIDGQVLNAEHVGFTIGPRINAAGRLDSADPAVQLLITENEEEGMLIAAEIDSLNKERQALVNKMAEEAIEEVVTNFPPEDNSVLIIGKEGWNSGVIGIVASRLVEKFYRPTIVLSIDKEKGLAKGSARSIEGFDMFTNLSLNKELLPHFGGHPMAAGLTMRIEDIDELRERLNCQAKEQLTENDFIPITNVDLETTIDQISVSVIEQMEALAPFGVSNPTPKIVVKDVTVQQIKRIGSEENHLKVVFEQDTHSLEGIGFHFGYLQEEITSIANVSALGKLSINEWNGRVKPQLMLEDVDIDEWQLFDWRNAQRLQEKIANLPKAKRRLVCFREETIEYLALGKYAEEISIVHEQEELKEDGGYIILLDLPYSSAQLEHLLRNYENIERIYAVFSKQVEHFFSTQPSREQFKWYYSFLLKKQTFHLNEFGEQLAKHKGWSKDTIKFMTKVFFELGFVTINNGFITIEPNPEKKDLLESKTYQRKMEEAQLENQFVYSTYLELKQWFDKVVVKDKLMTHC